MEIPYDTLCDHLDKVGLPIQRRKKECVENNNLNVFTDEFSDTYRLLHDIIGALCPEDDNDYDTENRLIKEPTPVLVESLMKVLNSDEGAVDVLFHSKWLGVVQVLETIAFDHPRILSVLAFLLTRSLKSNLSLQSCQLACILIDKFLIEPREPRLVVAVLTKLSRLVVLMTDDDLVGVSNRVHLMLESPQTRAKLLSVDKEDDWLRHWLIQIKSMKYFMRR